MARIETWYKQDLKRPVKVQTLMGNVFTLDNVGSLIGVEVFSDGVEETLTGAATGYCILPDGTTISVPGTRSGNKAYILLPQSALAYPGLLKITVKLTNGNEITTLLAVIATVARSRTDAIITPSQQIITDWSQQIAAEMQAVEDASAAQDAKIDDLKSAINVEKNGLSLFTDEQKVDLSRGTFVNGAYNPATRNLQKTYTYRVSAITEIIFPYAITIKADNGFSLYPYTKTNDEWIGRGWHTEYGIPANVGFYLQIGRSTEDTSEIADIPLFVSKIRVSGNPELVSKEYADGKYATLTDLLNLSNDVNAQAEDEYANRIVEGNFQDANVNLITKGKWARGVFDPNAQILNDYPYRISLLKAVSFPYFATLVIKNGFRIVYYYNNGSTWVSSGWQTGTVNISENTPIYLQIARVTEDTSEIADISEFITAVTVKGSYFDINGTEYWDLKKSLTFKYIDFEFGGWYSSSGTLKKANTGNDRIRSQQPIPTPQSIRFIAKKDGISFYAFCMDDNNNYVGNKATGGTKGTHRMTFEAYPTFKKVCAVVVCSDFTSLPANLDDYFEVYFENDSYVKTGKQTLIYKFGGAGNDWCFVRTPANYNQFRDKPYPFVICNHGNGWTMDGNLLTSNWTNITMYWSDSKDGWIAGRMIDTDDESLWGSNPTIEALLAAGYVVCGCENYADAQYGNTLCRNACVDFFYHIISRYNVEKRCYMIGASNGAMTSLNAAYILQGAVKAMILQYPLTCLVDQYFSNTSQQAGIKSAYGIPGADVGSEDTAENRAKLTKYVATHDPLTVDVVDGKKIGSFPPVKLYYSPEDTVTRASVNALVLYDLLEASNKVVEKVQCSGAHGDQSHFAPAEYVAWFNAH